MQPGLHFSTLQRGVMTLDLRFKRPNAGDYVSPAALHSIEHMLATALRNGPQKEHILYFGPMGCRTGFYLLTEGLTYREAYEALRAALAACADMGAVPGARRSECGNYFGTRPCRSQGGMRRLSRTAQWDERGRTAIRISIARCAEAMR